MHMPRPLRLPLLTLRRGRCATAFARHHVLPTLNTFLARYPQIKLELVLDDSHVNLIHAFTWWMCSSINAFTLSHWS